MIDPRTVMVAIPCYDGKVMAELTGMLVTGARLFGAISLPTECSHISLVRNLIAAQFMASSFEWLVCIDSDTIPSSPRDLELLLEPCDSAAHYFEDQHSELGFEDQRSNSFVSSSSVLVPCPTRLLTPQCIAGRPLDEKTLSAADLLVCAEYSFKNDNLEPVKLGMGFVRIHRSVFERLQELKYDGGPTVEVRRDLMERVIEMVKCGDDWEKAEALSVLQQLVDTREDKAGQGRLWQVSWKGRMYYDYYPSGPLISQFVPTAEWKGEDHGFFTLCMLAGVVPRIETRTRLIHMGRKGYPYLGPDSGGGQ